MQSQIQVEAKGLIPLDSISRPLTLYKVWLKEGVYLYCVENDFSKILVAEILTSYIPVSMYG